MEKIFEDKEFHGIVKFFRAVFVEAVANLSVSGNLLASNVRSNSFNITPVNAGALEVYLQASATFSSVSLFLGDTENTAKQSIVANHVQDKMSFKIGGVTVCDITDAGLDATGYVSSTNTVNVNLSGAVPLVGDMNTAFPSAPDGFIGVMKDSSNNNRWLCTRDYAGSWAHIALTATNIS